jgi:hypothetical protein
MSEEQFFSILVTVRITYVLTYLNNSMIHVIYYAVNNYYYYK